LIAQGEAVQTISVPAVLAVYNWNKDTDRYRRCARFVEYLFDRFEKLREKPYQPGWKDMNLAGTIPGWTRFPPAQALVAKAAAQASADANLTRTGARTAADSKQEQEQLFKQFLEWSKQQKRR
jgi:hypothetical protein